MTQKTRRNKAWKREKVAKRKQRLQEINQRKLDELVADEQEQKKDQ